MKLLSSACACLLLAALAAAPARAQGTTMDALWPNDDLRSWDYALHFESFDGSGQVVDGQVRLWFDGTTVGALFREKVPYGKASDYLIRVNRQPAAANQLLAEGDRISFTPTKIEGAL